MGYKLDESPIQQAVLNCIDFFNTELKSRKVDKQYHIALNILDSNKSAIIGAKKDKKVIIDLIFSVKTSSKTEELWGINRNIDILNPTEKVINREVDQCFLSFLKECIGTFGLITEQTLKARRANR
jgi:hypothetical protein